MSDSEGNSLKSYKDFFANKNAKFVGTVKKGKYHGDGCQEYRKDKSLRFEGGFEEGKWHGDGKKYFKNGQIEFEGGFKGGNFHGDTCTEFRDDGTKRYEGSFVDGMWEGAGTKYFDNDVIQFVGKFKNRQVDGDECKEYRMDGSVRYEGDFIEGRWEGKGIYYHANGSKKYEGPFVNNVLDGETCKEYDEENNMVYDGQMKNGKFHGPGKRFYPGDVLKFEGDFEKGRYIKGKEFREDATLRYEGDYNKDRKFHGDGTFYYRGGTVKEKGAYHNGKLHGETCEEYREGGGLRYQGAYEKGKRNGKGISFYENGNKKYEGSFKDDKCQDEEGTEYKEDATLHYKGSFVNGNWEGEGTRYYEDGSVLFTGEFREGRRYKGKEFRRDGVLRYEGLYRDGQYEGEGKYYGREGELKWEGDFIDGLIDCENGKQYFKNGQMEYEGEFQCGKPEGFGKQFDTEGTLIREGYFVDGKYYGKKPPKGEEKRQRPDKDDMNSSERRKKRSLTNDASPELPPERRDLADKFDGLNVELNAEIETPSSWSNLCGTRPTWEGFFDQDGTQTTMTIDNFHINHDGTVNGDGKDDIGEFTISGTIGDANEVAFGKQYTGAHLVNYTGTLEGSKIAGNWEIPDSCVGTFELSLSASYTENWTGWFKQGEDPTDMTLDLHVDETGVFGLGSDTVGNFVMRGIYQMDTGVIRFIKKYIGQHEVLYRGMLTINDNGMYLVDGEWEIIDNCKGVFHLEKSGGQEIKCPKFGVEIEVCGGPVEFEVEVCPGPVEVEVEVAMPEAEVELVVDVGGGLEVDVGGGLEVDVGGGLEVDVGGGLEVNVDLGGGLEVNVDLGGGLDRAIPVEEVEVTIVREEKVEPVEIEAEVVVDCVAEVEVEVAVEAEVEVEVVVEAEVEVEVAVEADVEVEVVVEAEVEAEPVVEEDLEWMQWGGNLNTKEIEWSGWFDQDGTQTEMYFDRMFIDFDMQIYGSGQDTVGIFTITGTWGEDGAVNFVKQYEGAHAVNYTGTFSSPTKITGDWEIPDNCKGTFEMNVDLEAWEGTFNQGETATEMQLMVDLDQDGIWGRGSDDVGNFLVKGDWIDGVIRFAKKYIGAHVVLYTGAVNADGGDFFGISVSGTWEIKGNCDGIFEIHRAIKKPEGPPTDCEGWGACEALEVNWTGYFQQDGSKTEMKFANMQVQLDGAITGQGMDDVGHFEITGKLEQNNELGFVKQYVGAHAVNYTGQLKASGVIKGSWEIPENCAGDFKIKMSFNRWKGFFEQSGNETTMKLKMHVVPEGIFGIGSDEVGSFIVRGDWEAESNLCRFVKQYIGQHQVLYHGILTKHKRWTIDGFWAIPGNCDGKFKLKRQKMKDNVSSANEDSGVELCAEVEINI